MLKYQYIHIWSERKVLNKYFPPDFDPNKIPRRKVVKELQQKVRLMAPFSMQCSTCGDYIYKGKKFNARKERSEGEKYLNIQIYRFYIRCPKCAAEITFKTDPRNTDYVAEHGAVRNFEPWRDQSTTQDAMDSEKAIEEENNPMRALENRTIESKREMDILDALDEIRTKNAHLERIISVNQTEIQANSAEDLAQKLQALQDDEDSKLASSIFQTVDGESVRRIDDDVDLHDLISQSEVAATTSFDIPEQQFKVPKPITSSQSLINSNPSVIGKRKQICTPIDLGIKVRKRTVESVSSSNVVSKSQEKKVATSALVHTLASLATYPDSDED